MSRVVCADCQDEGRDGCFKCGLLPVPVELEEIWTFDSDPSTRIPHPIWTRCAAGKFGYPHREVHGDQMFENTHFRTEEAAWAALIANADAHQRMCASDFRQVQKALEEATSRLAIAAAFASEVHAERAKRTPR